MYCNHFYFSVVLLVLLFSIHETKIIRSVLEIPLQNEKFHILDTDIYIVSQSNRYASNDDFDEDNYSRREYQTPKRARKVKYPC